MSNRRASVLKVGGFDFDNPEVLVFVVKSDNGGTSSDNQFTLPVLSILNSFTIYTEDGQTIAGVDSGSITITFPIAGTYKIAIQGVFKGFLFNNGGDKLKLIDIIRFGNSQVSYETNQGSAFYGCQNLVNVPNHPFLNNMISAIRTFQDCDSLVFDDAITFASITNASYMFSLCQNITMPLSCTFAALSTGFSMFQQSAIVSIPDGVTFGNLLDARNMFYISSFQTLGANTTFAKLTNGTNMFSNSGISDLPASVRFDKLTVGAGMFQLIEINPTRYNQLLIDLEAFNVSNNVDFTGGTSKYFADGLTARNILTSAPRSWTITDGGLGVKLISISVSPSTVTISDIGETQLTVTYSPTNATNKSGVWSSSNDLFATVDQNGLVTGVSIGIATITFTSNEGGFTDNSVITVESILTNIISEYKLNTDSLDFVGTNNGTDTSISYVAGLVDDCADFTAGVTSNIDVGSGLVFGDGVTDVPFSVSFAVKLNVVNTVQMLLAKNNTAGTIFEYRSFFVNNILYFDLYDLINGDRLRINTTLSIVASTWYHLTLTYDGSSLNTGMEMYLDGNLQTPTRSVSGTYVAMQNTGEPLLFGKRPQDTTQSLNGYMDCIAFWDKELTATEVLYIATDELNGTDINP